MLTKSTLPGLAPVVVAVLLAYQVSAQGTDLLACPFTQHTHIS